MNIFIAFANQDRDVRDKLLRQMNLVKDRQGWNIWTAKEINAGEVWGEEIERRLRDSEVVILLLSADFFSSEYIMGKELPEVVEKHKKGNCQIIPVIARQCHWKDTPFGEYAELGQIQALPVGEKPIMSKGHWDNEDEPYFETVQGIKDSIKSFRDRIEAQLRTEREAAEQKRAAALALEQAHQRQRDETARKEREAEERRKQEETTKKQREKEQADKSKAEGLAWNNAEQLNTEEVWEKFLKDFRDSPFRAEAQKKLDALRKVRLDDLAAKAQKAEEAQKRRDQEAQAAQNARERLAAQQRTEREAAEKRATAEAAWEQEQKRQRDEAARKQREQQTQLEKEKAARQRQEQSRPVPKEAVRPEPYRSSSTSTYSSSGLTSRSWFLILGALGLVFWFVIKNYWNEPQLSENSKVSGSLTAQNQPTSTEKKSGLEMVAVQGGTFLMGSPKSEEGRLDNECQHSVNISSFSIGKYEVTQADWRRVMAKDLAHFKDCDDCPVESVAWYDVRDFLETLNSTLKSGQKKYRLPTEAEWEYAARGGDYSRKTKYSGSDNPSIVAWYSDNSEGVTHPVGGKIPNEFGLYDMSGNVKEWCEDPYDSFPCSKSFANASIRVLRGGSYSDFTRFVRLAHRDSYDPSKRRSNNGFRLAHD